MGLRPNVHDAQRPTPMTPMISGRDPAGLSNATYACPACLGPGPLHKVEEHRDPIAGQKYVILECGGCGVVSSTPRIAVGPDWYEKASPIRGREGRAPAEADWRFAQFFRDRVPAGKLLDIGCGDGGFLRLAAAAGFSPSGFDYDERMVAQARAAGIADAHAAELSAYCASREAAEFDVITLFDVLEHFPEPVSFLWLVKRLLKPGGHLAVTLPNAQRPLPWGREEHDYPPHHFTRWTPKAMRGFLEREGFTIVRQEAGALKLDYISDHFFFYRVMPPILGLAKSVLFGKRAEEGKTVSELYGHAPSGGLGDKVLRQRLVNGARWAFSWLFLPVAAVMAARYRRREPLSGDCLYTLARLG